MDINLFGRFVCNILYKYHQNSKTIVFFLVAGAGVEPAILAYETKLVTITINPHNVEMPENRTPGLNSFNIKSFTSLVNFFPINKVRLLFYIYLLKDGMLHFNTQKVLFRL